MITTVQKVDTQNGEAEIFLNQLDVVADEFISDLSEQDKEKPTTFLRLLKYVYVQCFKPQKTLQYNCKSVLKDADTAVIEAVWDWYCSLALSFGRTPTVLQFCTLTGFNRHTLQDWREGNTRKETNEYSAVSEKMKQESEAFLEARAYESNSVGAIFGLKASHFWREASPILPELPRTEAHATLAEIRERHKDATLPEPVDFTGMDFDDED